MKANRVITFIAGSLIAGCASTPPPQKALTDAHAAIRGAETIGAEQNPDAELALKRARDGVAEAETLMEDDRNEDAQLALERAQIDAEMAILLTKKDDAKVKAEKALERIRELKSQG